MSWWPGWNSIQSASFWAHFWFWLGIACLLALAASQIVSYRYGLRKDELLEAAANAAETKRLRAQQEERDRHAAEVGRLRTQLDQTPRKVDEDRPLKSRIRAALAAIDTQIVRRIDGGAVELMVRMQPSDFATLTALVGEPGGHDLLSLTRTGWVQRNATINDGSIGPTATLPEQWRVVLKFGGGLRSK
jgi:hypothetical protein